MEPDPDRRSVRFETTLPAGPRTGQVRFVATDAAGTTDARELSDDFGRPVVPDLRLDGSTTRRRDGVVRVHGSVVGGELERVAVETTTADGEWIALATVHARAVTRQVDVDGRY